MEVQELLERWVEGDRASGEQALRLLQAEWRPLVRRFLRDGSDSEVDEWLQDALLERAVFARGATPKAMAPPNVSSPRAWRRQVLKNHLRDRLRSVSTRRHYEQLAGEGWAPRRKGDESAYDEVAKAPARDLAPDDASFEETLRRQRREWLVAMLPRLSIRRRFCAALRLDPPTSVEAWVPALAQSLGEPGEAVGGRVEAAQRAPHDPERRIEVFYPGAGPKERDAYRKLQARTDEELVELLGGGE